eukprot:m.106323 g.106323  ORF g.106323 m.106323 type:complete len:771 (+) comp15772_c1_seq1:598-2910(+)
MDLLGARAPKHHLRVARLCRGILEWLEAAFLWPRRHRSRRCMAGDKPKVWVSAKWTDMRTNLRRDRNRHRLSTGCGIDARPERAVRRPVHGGSMSGGSARVCVCELCSFVPLFLCLLVCMYVCLYVCLLACLFVCSDAGLLGDAAGQAIGLVCTAMVSLDPGVAVRFWGEVQANVVNESRLDLATKFVSALPLCAAAASRSGQALVGIATAAQAAVAQSRRHPESTPLACAAGSALFVATLLQADVDAVKQEFAAALLQQQPASTETVLALAGLLGVFHHQNGWLRAPALGRDEAKLVEQLQAVVCSSGNVAPASTAAWALGSVVLLRAGGSEGSQGSSYDYLPEDSRVRACYGVVSNLASGAACPRTALCTVLSFFAAAELLPPVDWTYTLQQLSSAPLPFDDRDQVCLAGLELALAQSRKQTGFSSFLASLSTRDGFLALSSPCRAAVTRNLRPFFRSITATQAMGFVKQSLEPLFEPTWPTGNDADTLHLQKASLSGIADCVLDDELSPSVCELLQGLAVTLYHKCTLQIDDDGSALMKHLSRALSTLEAGVVASLLAVTPQMSAGQVLKACHVGVSLASNAGGSLTWPLDALRWATTNPTARDASQACFAMAQTCIKGVLMQMGCDNKARQKFVLHVYDLASASPSESSGQIWGDFVLYLIAAASVAAADSSELALVGLEGPGAAVAATMPAVAQTILTTAVDKVTQSATFGKLAHQLVQRLDAASRSPFLVESETELLRRAVAQGSLVLTADKAGRFPWLAGVQP